jgi:hypothetical protein
MIARPAPTAHARHIVAVALDHRSDQDSELLELPLHPAGALLGPRLRSRRRAVGPDFR